MKTKTFLPATWLTGEKTRLRPLEPQDVPLLRRYRLTIDRHAIPYVIQTLAGRDIGALGLSVSGPQGAIAIAFSDRRYLRDGSGADALRVMCSGARRSMPLVRIEALVPADDVDAVGAYLHAGFKREGVLRSVLREAGNFRDAAMLSEIRHAEG